MPFPPSLPGSSARDRVSQEAPLPSSLSLLPNIALHFIAVSPCSLPHSHLDNHCLWEPKVFAIRCFKIIMYSIQVWWLPVQPVLLA